MLFGIIDLSPSISVPTVITSLVAVIFFRVPIERGLLAIWGALSSPFRKKAA